MNILDIIPFVPANITTNVPLTETAWVAGQYNTGDRVYILPSYDLYEAVATQHTNDEPIAGAALEPPSWVKVGKVNRYNCFDGVLTNATTFSSGLDMTIAGGDVFKTGIAMFGLIGGWVQVTVYDAADVEVFDKTYSLLDDAAIKDLWDYHTSPIRNRQIVVDLGLPPYVTSKVRIRIDGPGQIGEIAVGYATNLGRTRWGAGSQIDDYSTVEFNTFGQPSVIRRGYSTSIDVNGFVPTGSLGWARRELASRRATPTVFIGSPSHESTIAYGLFRDIATVMSGPSISDVSIKVKGIV